jgi:endothelin-converting enzyme
MRQILESDFIPAYTSSAPPDDERILEKLRSLYFSCMNEERLDLLDKAPLVRFVETLRDLFRGEGTDIGVAGDDGDQKKKGLTAAIAFLHSRGEYPPKYRDPKVILIACSVGIGALFSFDVDGDSKVDPNAMTLWFSQPELGLPSKVCALIQCTGVCFADLLRQEYYEDESIRDVYRDVIERLLSTLAEDDNGDVTTIMTDTLVQQDNSENAWPPWPWPPWGDDDDGEAPKPKPESPHILARKVLEFESRIAEASLDLCVETIIFLGIDILTYNWLLTVISYMEIHLGHTTPCLY